MLADLATARARTVEDIRPLIEIDEVSSHPWRVLSVRHCLSDHPLLQAASLVALDARLEARESIRAHCNEATAGTPFNDASALRCARFTLVES